MRISDWSSDVCSSDLIPRFVGNAPGPASLPQPVDAKAEDVAQQVVARCDAAEHIVAPPCELRCIPRVRLLCQVHGSGQCRSMRRPQFASFSVGADVHWKVQLSLTPFLELSPSRWP